MEIQHIILLLVLGVMILVLIFYSERQYSLNNIKNKQVGDGQYGTACFASEREIKQSYKFVHFDVKNWRKGINLPSVQGTVLGHRRIGNKHYALVDEEDSHTLMIGAAGVGKTAYFLYPNIEYACASGMSFLNTDTKGDIYQNYGVIAQKYYGYNVAVIDLRNPLESDRFNMMHLVNRYMDLYLEDKSNISAKAKSEKYAKIISKTIITADEEGVSHGQNQYFYDTAESLLTSLILILAEFGEKDARHIVSVCKMMQDLIQVNPITKTMRIKELINSLPITHKARWYAGPALNVSDASMLSTLSTALSKLNTFIDSELEQALCFNTDIDAEKFCNEKCAIFVILPEEDPVKYFLVSLIIQQLYREILVVASEKPKNKLERRVMFYLDEIGTIPKIESAEMMFSASRSRNLLIVAIIQSIAQLSKNYGDNGAEIIIDNCKNSIFGGFAPHSKTADVLSENLGYQTILTGTVSRGNNSNSQSLQMSERRLMTTDELKTMEKGTFIVTKTGTKVMKTKLLLYVDWGIKFFDEVFKKRNEIKDIVYVDTEQIVKKVISISDKGRFKVE